MTHIRQVEAKKGGNWNTFDVFTDTLQILKSALFDTTF